MSTQVNLERDVTARNLRVFDQRLFLACTRDKPPRTTLGHQKDLETLFRFSLPLCSWLSGVTPVHGLEPEGTYVGDTRFEPHLPL